MSIIKERLRWLAARYVISDASYTLHKPEVDKRDIRADRLGGLRSILRIGDCVASPSAIVDVGIHLELSNGGLLLELEHFALAMQHHLLKIDFLAL